MKWQGRTGSRNVLDRRTTGGKAAIGGIGIVVLIAYTLLTGDPSMLIGNLLGGGSTNTQPLTAEEQALGDFASVVLKDTEDVWTTIFQDYNMTYEPAKMILYRDGTESGCGYANAQVGPFYCSLDQSVYIDLSFFATMRTKLGASGDFAMAYVIAHEIGHHVQHLTGVLDDVQEVKQGLTQTQANELNVRLELQADYLAGVWANHVQGMGYLEDGDIDEAMNAAAAVGDDRIQEQATGRVTPDNFTHGTSEQRQRWFRKGFVAGDLEQWDTFNVSTLFIQN
ncbi:MAG TPA: metalloprotease [Erysipelotrichaceae bacterium]|nr:metalloprotease [Erysipelotrichaceae bacterium]